MLPNCYGFNTDFILTHRALVMFILTSFNYRVKLTILITFQSILSSCELTFCKGQTYFYLKTSGRVFARIKANEKCTKIPATPAKLLCQ